MNSSSIRDWAAGRSWTWRALVLTLLVHQTLRPLREEGAWSLFSGIAFGAHEFGHLLFAFAGEWMSVAGGSLAQLLVPLGAVALMVRARDWFGVSAGALFFAASLAELSWYIGDARTELMDLVSFSEEGAIHDWNYLLASLGMLEQDQPLARTARFVAWIVLLGATAFALQLFRWMATLRPASHEAPQ